MKGYRYGYLMIVDSCEEIKNLGDIIFDDGLRIRINGFGVFELDDKKNWPKYFMYEEPYDLHFCGTYHEVTKDEAKEYLIKELRKKNDEIADISSVLQEVR